MKQSAMKKGKRGRRYQRSMGVSRRRNEAAKTTRSEFYYDVNWETCREGKRKKRKPLGEFHATTYVIR